MPRTARICSVSLHLREPPPLRLRSTLAKASFVERDSDSETYVTEQRTLVKRAVTPVGASWSQVLAGVFAQCRTRKQQA
jgi:hypothetical protein